MTLYDRLKTLLSLGLAMVGVALVIGLAIDSSAAAPKHAIVFVDREAKIYMSPPCVESWRNQGPTEAERLLRPYALESTTLGQAQGAGFTPEPECRDEGGFSQDMRSLTGEFLEEVGILPPLKRRWNEDGSWNW